MELIGCIFEVVVLVCLAAGIASNAAVVGSCDMLDLQNGSIGPWRADIDGSGCVLWDKTNEATDWILNMARVCSMMGFILGCILAFFGFFKQCLCPLPCSQIIMDISGIGLQISLALVWPMIRSQVCKTFGCRWGGGATALLLAQIFFFAASILSRCMREPRYERRKTERNSKEEQATKEAVEQPIEGAAEEGNATEA
ncbi:hypothetical protein ACHAWT_009118 [Skeletonema menzelii]